MNKLDQVLCGLNVQRQAYHGKCFIGNHVHKILQIFSSIFLHTCKHELYKYLLKYISS